MAQLHIAIAVMLGIAGLLAFPAAMGLKLRMHRLKSAEIALFIAMAVIGIIGYGDKFSPTNDPPRSAGGPQLITPDPGTGPFTDIAPFEVSNLCFTAIAATHTSLWAAVAWPPTLSSERAERFALDDRTYPVAALGASAAYDIGSAMGEIVGGLYTLNSRVWHLDFAATNAATFRIRGKNPLDADAKTYIDSHVDAEFAGYAWMIAKHESKAGDRVYNQFNPANPLKELPNKTNGQDSWGWGIGQIDKGTNGCVAAEVYDWHRNVESVNATLRDKLSRYSEIVRLYRNAYQSDSSTRWFEPDSISTNINGTVVSARQWSIMTLYNGTRGAHPLPFAGHEGERTPIHFDPATTNWILYTNSNDYVPTVLADSSTTEVE